MRAVLFCLVVSANALPEAHLRGRVKDHLRDRDLSVPEDAKNYYANTDASSDEISTTNLEEGGFLGKLLRRFGLASTEKASEETAGGRVGGAPGPGEGDVLAASIKGTLSHVEDAPNETKVVMGSKGREASKTGGSDAETGVVPYVKSGDFTSEISAGHRRLTTTTCDAGIGARCVCAPGTYSVDLSQNRY